MNPRSPLVSKFIGTKCPKVLLDIIRSFMPTDMRPINWPGT